MHKKKIDKIGEQIEKLREARKEAIKEWVKAEHPLRLRQKVEVNYPVPTGKKIVVGGINVREYTGNEWRWTACGRLIKKMGRRVCLGANGRKMFK